MIINILKSLHELIIAGIIFAAVTVSCQEALGNSKPNKVEIVESNLIRIDQAIDVNSIGISTHINYKAKNTKAIDLLITSNGGSFDYGNLIIESMENSKKLHNTKFRCFVPMFAGSMAAFILLYCDNIYVLKDAKILFHEFRMELNESLTYTDTLTISMTLLEIDSKVISKLVSVLDVKYSKIYPIYLEDKYFGVEFWNSVGKNKWLIVVDEMSGIKDLFTVK